MATNNNDAAENTTNSANENFNLIGRDLPERMDLFFEQYKLMISGAEKVSERRASVNKFYISLLSGVFAVLAFILGDNSLISGIGMGLISSIMVLLGIFGYFLANIWKANIKSFQMLNAAKYQVINAMEKYLPSEPYGQEWTIFWEEIKNIVSKTRLNLPSQACFK